MNIAIVGLGLIGGSLGRAFLKRTEHNVFGTDVNADTISKASLLNAITEPLTDDNISLADIIIFALTPKVFYEEAEKYLPKLKNNAIVMDIIGVKDSVVKYLKEKATFYPTLEFVSTHPMAGKEFSGISHSSPNLFERASMLLVPIKAEIQTLQIIKNLFLSIGFDLVKITTAKEHDEIIAYTSQLAHIVSSAYVNSPLAERHDGFSAGSFKDMTRVARMNSSMWTELFLDNRENVLPVLSSLIKNLEHIKTLIESKDFASLDMILNEGNLKKEQIEMASLKLKKNRQKTNENDRFD